MRTFMAIFGTFIAPYDPNLPIRGRYVRLQMKTEARDFDEPGNSVGSAWGYARLSVEGDRLVATRTDDGVGHHERRLEVAGQALQAACDVDRVADQREGETVLGADVAHYRGPVVEANADRKRRCA